MITLSKMRSLARKCRSTAGTARRKVINTVGRARSRTSSAGIALTYDDGPDENFTPALLDVLKEGGVTATFFVLGDRAVEHPAIVRRMVLEGHAVGSHSMTHPDFRRTAISAVRRDVVASRDALQRITGAKVQLFRPPHGRLTLSAAAMLRFSGYRTWLWNVDSYDWKPGASSDKVITNVAAAGPGDVVLFHDTKEHTVAATRAIIAHFHESGVPFVALGGDHSRAD